MKKFLTTFLIIFCLTLNFTVYGTDYTECVSKTYEQKFEELKNLGIINCYEDGSFYPEKNITRAEFCKMVALISGYDGNYNIYNPEHYFHDVDIYHWANGHISFCYENGIVGGVISPEPLYGVSLDKSGVEVTEVVGYSNLADTKFEPERSITYPECFKMVLRATGYTPRAEAMGGYPQGYVTEADMRPLIKAEKPDYKTNVTRKMAVEIIYNALHLPLLVKKDTKPDENDEWYIADGTGDLEYITLYTKNFGE